MSNKVPRKKMLQKYFQGEKVYKKYIKNIQKVVV